MTKYRLTIEVTEEQLHDLQTAAMGAALGAKPITLLQTLVEHVSSGVRRPGAWERAWLRKVAFDVHGQVEPDERPHRDRPKRPMNQGVQLGVMPVEVEA